jgi:hypothetical protein
MFFRWEKYRLVSQYESFSDSYFSTIIAVLESVRVYGTYTIYWGMIEKAGPLLTLPGCRSHFPSLAPSPKSRRGILMLPFCILSDFPYQKDH